MGIFNVPGFSGMGDGFHGREQDFGLGMRPCLPQQKLGHRFVMQHVEPVRMDLRGEM